MNVSYYLNFVDEKRISMDEYGSELINYQKKNFPQLKINEFKPKLSPLSKLIFNFKFKMRYARYISYPQQVKKLLIQDIAHICDQQYAHLFSSINSRIKIITVNDLVPIVLQKQTGHKPHLLNYSLKKLKYFDRIIAISETTKKDILKYTDCNEEKISVVMRGVDPLFNDYKINEKETDDPSLIWTLCGVPAINIPNFKSPEGLPFGIQVIARKYNDKLLIQFIKILHKLNIIKDGPYPKIK